MEHDNPLVPPGFDKENTRVIRIPRYPNDPLRQESFDEYNVDVRWLLIIQDQIHLQQLEYIMSWYATLSHFLWKSRNALKVVTSFYKERLLETKGEASITKVKEEYLPKSYDWFFWKGQVEWLEVAVESLGRLISPMQSYNATRRIELSSQTP